MKTTITQTIEAIVLASFILLNMPKMNYAQETSILFESFPVPVKNNLDNVLDITQDSTGFMWFGSANGLYRYDGYNFTQFTHDPADSTSLSSNDIETIYVDQEGTLWIGTFSNGLDQFHHETETFSHFQHDPQNPMSISSDSITVFTEDQLGRLWVGTRGGLNRLDRETNTFTQYHYDPNDSSSLSRDRVRALYEDSEGTLWVGTHNAFPGEIHPGPGGLNRYNRESDTFTRYLHNPDDPNSLMSNHIMAMYEDSGGSFWIGTIGNVLHKMDRETSQFERFMYDPESPGTLHTPVVSSLPSSCEIFSCGGVLFINEDLSGSLWIGLFGEGMMLYEPQTGSLNQFDNRPDYSSTFSTNNIWKSFKSNDESLWISTLGGTTINKVTRFKRFFEHYSQGTFSVSVLHVASSGKLWGGELFDLYTLSPDMHDTLTYSNRTDIYINFDKTIATLEQSEDGSLWAGLYEGPPHVKNGGLYRLDSQSGELSSVVTDANRPDVHIGPIIDIYEDPGGVLWLATKYTGLFRYDRTLNTLTQYEHDPLDSNSLSDNNLTVIHGSKSDPGILWIGTERGLNRFEPEAEIFTRFLHDPDNPNNSGDLFINHIHEDSHSRLWIGTRTAGLHRFELNSQRFVRYSIYNSGISSNNVACILNDNDGFLWMGTEQGLTRFNPENELFYTFGETHGIQQAPFMNQCTRDSAGRLIFSGRNGFVVFQPEEIHTREQPSPVVLTNLYVSNQPIRPGSDSHLQRPIWITEQIQLPYGDNTFSFEFSELDFRDPEAIQYAYRLEGYNDSWRESGNLRRASYERIPAGNYVFRVRAANSDGVWNVEGVSIGITILPPWWQTWWAYGLYALIFAAGFFAVDRFQRRRLLKREREKARERELEQAREIEKAYHNLEVAHENLKAAQDQLVQQEKLASLGQLTAGIAHEIKNPLNFVNNFSDLSVELVEEAREEVKGQKSKVKSEKSPFEGGKDGEAGQGDDHDLILDILNDIETNLRKIHEHGTRADGIVKSMLQHSRGGSGKMEPTDVNALVKEFTNLAYHGMRAGKNPIDVDIDMDLDDEVGKVELITEDFSRVILNLCNNAFDAMREKLSAFSSQQSEKSPFEGGAGATAEVGDDSSVGYKPKLAIRTHQSDQTITIEIQDNGPGIPDEIKDKILQPFFTTKKGTAGTGLGLSITNDIIKAHGGELDIDSKENEFTRFTIQLTNKNEQA